MRGFTESGKNKKVRKERGKAVLIGICDDEQSVGYETIIIFFGGYREMSREITGGHAFDFIPKDFCKVSFL